MVQEAVQALLRAVTSAERLEDAIGIRRNPQTGEAGSRQQETAALPHTPEQLRRMPSAEYADSGANFPAQLQNADKQIAAYGRASQRPSKHRNESACGRRSERSPCFRKIISPTRARQAQRVAHPPAEPMALLPCWVFACGYKIDRKSVV